MLGGYARRSRGGDDAAAAAAAQQGAATRSCGLDWRALKVSRRLVLDEYMQGVGREETMMQHVMV